MENYNELQFQHPQDISTARRQLLPWWIKVGCWIFMIGAATVIIAVFFAAFGRSFEMNFYGLETTDPFSATGIWIGTILLFKGFSAYSLWTGKDHAINIAKADAIAGIVICAAVMVLLPMFSDEATFSIRLEPLILFLYYVTLKRIEYPWVNIKQQS